MKKYFEEIIKLKEEINDYSKKLMKSNEDYFNSNKETSQKIISLKEEMNKLTKENISLQEEKMALEKKNQDLFNSKEGFSFSEKNLQNTKEDTNERLHENKELNEKPSRKEIVKRIMTEVLNSKISQEEGEKKLLELIGEK